MLNEGVQAGIESALENVSANLIPQLLPLLQWTTHVMLLDTFYRAFERKPRHHSRKSEALRMFALFPHAGSGFLPDSCEVFCQRLLKLKFVSVQRNAGLARVKEGHRDLAVDILLNLRLGRISNADGR
jgi:hypothetical protein